MNICVSRMTGMPSVVSCLQAVSGLVQMETNMRLTQTQRHVQGVLERRFLGKYVVYDDAFWYVMQADGRRGTLHVRTPLYERWVSSNDVIEADDWMKYRPSNRL